MDHKFIRSKENIGAVLNTDIDALKAYKKKKKLQNEQNEKISKLENEISEISNTLQLILQKLEK